MDRKAAREFPGLLSCQIDRLHCSRCTAKRLRMYRLTKHVWCDFRHFMWMICHGKYWPQEIIPWVLGSEDNLYAYKSITEKVRAQGKITLTRSLHKWSTLQCKVYFLLLKYFTNVLFIWVDAISICLRWCDFFWLLNNSFSCQEDRDCGSLKFMIGKKNPMSSNSF